MKEKIVYAVVGDIGGAREVLPAMQMLEKKYGTEIKWFVDASLKAKAGTDVLDKAGIVYETRWPVPDDNPDVVVYGTSETAIDAQMMWSAFGRTRKKDGHRN